MRDPFNKEIVERALSVDSLKNQADRNTLRDVIGELTEEIVDVDMAVLELERLEALIKIDEHFHKLLQNDQLDFLRAMLVLESDEAFARDVQLTTTDLTRALQRYIKNRLAWNATRQTENTLIRAIGLAISNLHAMVKWGLFLHEEVSSPPWKIVHSLYHLAETDGFALVPFLLRPQVSSNRHTIQSLYLRLLMISALNSGNLSKASLEIADGWYGQWCRDFRLEKTFSPDVHPFYLDFNKESGLHSASGKLDGESLRFLRADSHKAQIEEIQTGLRHGRLFSGFGIGSAFPVSEHVSVLGNIERLYNSMTSKSENRFEKRERLEGREVDVLVGFATLAHVTDPQLERKKNSTSSPGISELALLPIDAAASPQLTTASPAGLPDTSVEAWKLQDLSSNGYGFIIDRETSERVPLGCMLALLNQERNSWVIANVVRKLVKKDEGILVGAEVVSYHALPITLVPSRAGMTFAGRVERNLVQHAFYLPGKDRKGKQDSLLIGANDFTSAHPFELDMGDSRFTIRLNRIIKKGADWLQAKFEIESKRA